MKRTLLAALVVSIAMNLWLASALGAAWQRGRVDRAFITQVEHTDFCVPASDDSFRVCGRWQTRP
jgi:hypothetical protein